jgi:hypothetical protein
MRPQATAPSLIVQRYGPWRSDCGQPILQCSIDRPDGDFLSTEKVKEFVASSSDISNIEQDRSEEASSFAGQKRIAALR